MIFAPEEPGTDTLSVPVLKVFDGDGFLTRISDPQRNAAVELAVRFGFTDAPELEQPGGPEARDFLRSLIGDQWLELVILLKSDTGRIVDRHKRIVAVPYLRKKLSIDAPASRNIELEMILNGWTWVLERYGPDPHYLTALEDAQRHRRGIWAFDQNVSPWEFKKQRYREKSARKSAAPIQPPLFPE
jgi:endonuclease YncB( thermonuclease family)